MPLGTKLTQTDSDAIFEMIFKQRLNNDLYRQVEKTQRQTQGLKWVPLQEMTKIPFCMIFEIKCKKSNATFQRVLK